MRERFLKLPFKNYAIFCYFFLKTSQEYTLTFYGPIFTYLSLPFMDGWCGLRSSNFRLAFNFVRSDCGVRGVEAAVTVVDAVAAAAAAAAAAVTGVAAVGICKPSFSAIASKYSFR